MEVNTIYQGDCLEVMKMFPDNSIDSIVTDPPYGLSFMGKKWDYNVPRVEVWREVLRVLKPGGHVLVAGGTRTQHRAAVNVEDAGFEIRDLVAWVYGSGFPKSLNIGKQFGCGRWNGWGTALKPSMELWTLARKPLSEKSVAKNVLRWGTGGINVDGGRVSGRFPANFIHDGGEEVVGLFPNTKPTKPHGGDGRKLDTQGVGWGFKRMPCKLEDDGGSAARFFYCAKASRSERNMGCGGLVNHSPCYESYRPNYEKTKGVDTPFAGTGRTGGNLRNNHPTVKPISLMRYLCRLVTPKDGLILDPFIGSGTTGIAAKMEGFKYIGIEKEEEYCRIAVARINSLPPQFL